MSWSTFESEQPALAGAVLARFQVAKHHVLATLRSDGAPRVSGTEDPFVDGDLYLGSMIGALKARDLQREPPGPFHLFRLGVDLVVLSEVDQAREMMTITSWRPDRGVLVEQR